MAKKVKRSKYLSKGEVSSVSSKTLKAMRKDRTYVDYLICKLDSWSRGKRTMITIPNPNPNQTNKKFIRVEGREFFGDWKKQQL